MLIGIDAHNLEGKRTGVGRYVFNLLQEWSKLSENKFALYFKSEIPQDVPKSEFFECKLLKVGSTAKFTHWSLPRAAKKDKVDILFCPAYVAPLFYRGKVALTLHDISYEARPKEFNWLSLADRILLKWVSKKSAKKANIIFTPSEFSRQEAIKYYDVPAEKIITTPLSVDSDLFLLPEKLDDKIAEIKKKYDINDKFIFFIGSIFTRRHLTEIIQAFEQLTVTSRCQLLIGGRDYTDGKAVDKLVKKVNNKLKYEAILRVDFIGDEELKLLYSACAFFIWLSDYEGFGLPPLEAMAIGVPVITSDATSLKEVAGQAALLIKNNSDTGEIYQAMKSLAESEILRQEFIQKGKEQAARFSWPSCAEKTLEKLLKS
jgi:glycosyltransferase involved in cell wall biosynthesis